MSNVETDLESLIAFREHLIDFNRTLKEQFSSMRSHYAGLGESWNDDKYREYGEALDDVSAGIERYLNVTDEHENYLLGLIEALDEYLRKRIGR